jgi:hypothetical protein
VDLNLDTLKREIVEYLNAGGFAVFHSVPGGLEGQPLVLWDSERHPDYQMFLEVAQRAGISLILFATREFEAADLDEMMEHLETSDLPRDERRDYESRLRELRVYEGVTCSLELAFDYNSRLHVYEVQPDWYEEFLGIEEELMAHMSDEDESDDSLGGYFSKN